MFLAAPPEPGLTLYVKYSDPMIIQYEDIDIDAINNFIDCARKKWIRR